MMRTLFPLALLVLAACDGGKDGGASDTADTAGTDTGVDYEEGCITVGGTGGYASVNDAIRVANEGDTIQLCEGTYEEAVLLDKAVNLVGGSNVVIAGPANEVPLTITAAGASASGFTLTSTRTGMKIDGATGAIVTDVVVGSAASWGVSIVNGADVRLERLDVLAPEGGGIEVRGSTASFAVTTLSNPSAFGFDLEDSDVTLEGVSILGVTMLSDDISDGYGIQLNGGSLSLTDVDVQGAAGMGLFAQDSDVTLRGVSIVSPGFIGIFSFGTDYDVDGLTITDASLQGAYLEATTATLADTTITVTEDVAAGCSLAYEEWGTNGNPWCGGLLVAADTLNVQGVTIGGYNNYGLLLQPANEDTAALTLSDISIENVGRWALYLASTTGTATNVTVTGTREPELADACSEFAYLNWVSAAVEANGVDMVFEGLTLTDNAGFGVMGLQGVQSFTGGTFTGNACSDVMNFQGSSTVNGAAFADGGVLGAYWDYEGVSTITASTFTGAHADTRYTYTSGSDEILVEYSGYGKDIIATNSASMVITGNTFTDGDDSLDLNGVAAEVRGNSWYGYEGTILTTYYGSESRPPQFIDNTVDDVGGNVVYSLYGFTEVDGLEVGRTRMSTTTFRNYTNGELDYESSYTNYGPVFSAYGYYYDDGAGTIYDNQAGLALSDVHVVDAGAGLLSATDSVVDIDGLQADSVGTLVSSTAIAATWSGYPAVFEAEGLTLGAVTGPGVTLTSSYAGEGIASLQGVSITSTLGDAIATYGFAAVDVADFQVETANGAALRATATSYANAVTVTGADIGTTTGDGITLLGGSLSVNDVLMGTTTNCVGAYGATSVYVSVLTCDAASGYGLLVSDTTGGLDADTTSVVDDVTVGSAPTALAFVGGTASITNSTANASGSTGLSLTGSRAVVTGNVFTGLSEYGMVCSDTTLDTCSGNDLSNNTSGAHNGCSDTCDDL